VEILLFSIFTSLCLICWQLPELPETARLVPEHSCCCEILQVDVATAMSETFPVRSPSEFFQVIASAYVSVCTICSRFPVRYPPPMLWYPKIYHLHAICSISASHLHATCSVSEPQPPTCTLFAAFESHMLPTYDLHAVHSIYVFLFYLVYLYTSQAIVCLFIYIYTYYSSVAYDLYIICVLSIYSYIYT